MRFDVDVFAWIPHPDVPNPIAKLPGGTARWGRGACGPRFGGDNFVKPPAAPDAWGGLTFRARQKLSFEVSKWGKLDGVSTTGVRTGMTTVLAGPRPSPICHEMRAAVMKSHAAVAFSAKDNWYEAGLQGAAMDPIPRAVGQHVGGAVGGVFGKLGQEVGEMIGGGVAGTGTPQLEWDVVVRIQAGAKVPFWTSIGYGVECPFPTLDQSAETFPGGGPGGPLPTQGDNLIHGTAAVRRYPSYVVYVSILDKGRKAIYPVFFADASDRGLGEIVISQESQIQQVKWGTPAATS